MASGDRRWDERQPLPRTAERADGLSTKNTKDTKDSKQGHKPLCLCFFVVPFVFLVSFVAEGRRLVLAG